MSTDVVPLVNDDVLRYLGYNPNDVATRALVLVARRYQLDPMIGEIQLIQTRVGARVYVTRDGMIAFAHRSGQLDGIVVDDERRSSTNDGWTAYVSVWRKDCSHPFTYGAQCKDTEPQAKAGNGPEMALARAERRALKRAFAIPADVYPDGEPDLEDNHTDELAVEVSPINTIDLPLLPGEPPPPPPFVRPTDDQYEEIRDLLVQVGLDGLDNRERRVEWLSRTLGRPIGSTGDIDRDEMNVVIDALCAVVEHEPEDGGRDDE
jgi:hypothetical protein